MEVSASDNTSLQAGQHSVHPGKAKRCGIIAIFFVIYEFATDSWRLNSVNLKNSVHGHMEQTGDSACVRQPVGVPP
jgi:hypothetical protein